MTFSPSAPARVGIIGTGNIFDRYVNGMARFPRLRIAGCADLDHSRAVKAAADHGIAAYDSVEALLSDPDVDIVVNITPPVAHAAVSAQAIRAGKHVYVEKPVAATVAEAAPLTGLAREHGVLFGSAPDTFLGSAAQTARKALDDGVIGEPVGATAFVTHSKAETWHPNPGFLFAPGGGPGLDLGPYYLTSLVNLLGPIATVSGLSRVGAAVREVTSPDRTVDRIQVTTPTHAAAVLGFASGVIGSLQMSFDVWNHHLPFLEIYGTAGTLTIPDPNGFDGDVQVRGNHDSEWTTLPPVFPASGSLDMAVQMLRGKGVDDLAGAVDGAPHRATAELAFHVLEALEAVETSSTTRQVVELTSTVERPAPAAQ
ncbi:Gfo/Idh/MocA family protein [Streptomyces iconiensis]|uniref:Gfo/Idh/MocA family oxidoreductase n=1 Tax=Streptomyces iconiensis TaxID=1384038 RepID=A0ABT6ZPK6_9ACTN|nr:Gfo/Idh/MocA family oxidoreductase [Streptomyces iconiensis]MDJ1130983.1 Gfo/Idh/MocA family oxidoreductase [Streptomyces iconiensis]